MQFATEEDRLFQSEPILATPTKTLDELVQIVSEAAAASDQWMDRVRLRTDRRWYERLHHDADHDVWLISWMPGQSTGFHDHGQSSGAFTVVTGTLEEHRAGAQEVLIKPGHVRAFGADYAHDVINRSIAPAISIHAYSPPLTEMNEYELDGDELVPLERVEDSSLPVSERTRAGRGTQQRQSNATGIEQLLASARARLRRLSPLDAYFAVTQSEAILVDIRPEAQRASEGAIPGAVVIERNVLEWRLDPTSSARLPFANHYDSHVIVFCSEGYTSSLAAAALLELGLWRATDVIGGFQAWKNAGLPTTR